LPWLKCRFCRCSSRVTGKVGDPMATAESPGLSQNDSSECLVVTPNNQEIPDLTAWIVPCLRMLLGVNHSIRLFTLNTTEAIRLERKPCPRS